MDTILIGNSNKVTSIKFSYDNTHDNGFQVKPPEDQTQDRSLNPISFTPDQHKSLLTLLQQSSLSSSHIVNHLISQPKSNIGIIFSLPHHVTLEDFILDTGATDHVCFSKTKFTCLKIISRIIVKLPNRSLVTT